MQWDIITISLPWKYYVAECLRNQILPLWNPFIHSGFPQIGQYDTWYPITWIISLLFGYNILTIQYEHLLHLLIGAIGLFKLAKSFKVSSLSAFCIAVMYMFSGPFVSNAQHLGWTISGAWLPFTFYYYKQLIHDKNWVFNSLPKLLLVFFCFLTGGYPANFVTTTYILLIYFIYQLIKYVGIKDFQNARIWVAKNMSFAFIFFILSTVVLVNTFELSQFISRGESITYERLLQGSLTFKSLISLLLPFAVTTGESFWGSDLSLINSYFGLFSILFILYQLFYCKPNRKFYFLLIVALLFFMAAIPNHFPIRKLLYSYVPFMNYFRFSSLFRYFGVLFFLLSAGIGVTSYLNEKENSRKLFTVLILLLSLSLIAFFFTLNKVNFELIYNFKLSEIWNFHLKSTISDAIFINSIIQISLLVLFGLFYSIKSIPKQKLIVLFFIADAVISMSLNATKTIIKNKDPKILHAAIAALPDGYPNPNLRMAISATGDKDIKYALPNVWKNAGSFLKITSVDGLSPYYLWSTHLFYQDSTNLALLNNPLLFLSGNLVNNHVDYKTIDPNSADKIYIESFNPNEIYFEVNVNKPQTLIFLQNYYPHWKAIINGTSVNITITNNTFMSIPLNKGVSKVCFEFKPTIGVWAFYLSLSVFLLLVCIAVATTLKKNFIAKICS